MAKVLVRCTFDIWVTVPDNPGYDADFDLTENHGVGCGLTGAAIDAHIKDCDNRQTCWSDELPFSSVEILNRA